MPEVTFTKQPVICVDTVSKNPYGDLEWTDKDGGKYKIPSKRAIHFEKTIVPDMWVQLSYAMSSFGKEYIYSAVQVKDKIGPPVQLKPIPDSEIPHATPKPSPQPPESARKPPEEDSSLTIRGRFWWAQLGDSIRVGDIDKTKPEGKLLRTIYYAEMFKVLGINIEKGETTK